MAVRKALVCIGDSIFRGQPPVITWFRIVALFAVSAAVARELVVNGNAHLLPVVVTTFTELVDRYLAVWIYRQGGWVIIIIVARILSVERGICPIAAVCTVLLSWSRE